MIQLYSYFRSSASYRVRIALELKGLEYEYKPVHLVNNGGEQNRAEYRVLNSMGQVPCLVHDQFILTQSMAILHYLDDVFPEPELFPKEPQEKAKVIQLCEMVNSGIHPIQNLSVLNEVVQRYEIEKEGKIEWARFWIHRGFQAIEKDLQEVAGEYCFGDQLTAADLVLVPQVYNAHRFEVDMEAFPKIAEIEERCLKLDCFKKSEPGSQPDTP